MYRRFVVFLTAVATLITPTRSHAQGAACEGRVVSRVDVQSQPPPFSGYAKKWQAAAHTIGLHHADTRDEVIRAFLSLAPGKLCTERRRAESERVLRAQPFLARATVQVVADTGNAVVVHVTTVDEVPVLVSGRFRGIRPESFGIGNENLGGAALHVAGRVESGGAYRTNFGGLVEHDAFLGHPWRLVISGDRYQIGHRYGAEIEHPFFTDLQRVSWHGGIETNTDYERFERPAGDPLALQANDRSWDLSGMMRVYGTTTVTLVGAAISGRRFDPAARGIVVSDSGLLADSGSALANRYSAFRVGRIGVIAGVRRVVFQEVSGFDALVGSQDVARGAMIGVFAAKGLSQFGTPDMLVSSAAYAGAANRNTLVATLAQAEARRDPVTNRWDSMIGSARTAFYWGSAPGAVLVVDDEVSGGKDSRIPLQLSFRDINTGLIGYRNSGLAGSVRNIVRAEIRWSGESVVRKADLGFATFAHVGSLRAGDAPYGVNATRTTIGASLLGAYPTRSKRLYRVDLGFPLTRGGPGSGGVEVRFSSLDRTQGFWTEPVDVSRARTGTAPSRLFAWPDR